MALLENEISNLTLLHELETVSERGGAREGSEQYGAMEGVNAVSE